MPSSHVSYRADIDGMRAVAVLSVIVFHAFPAMLPGGFVGVDIFFVISGYLISSIIFMGIRERRFSFVDFYTRRARRIFPALCLVLSATLVAGWALLLPSEYMMLGKHVAAGSLFVANLALVAEGGYFDWASWSKPLLHLWSLGVEEQFYIIMPIVLAVTARRRWMTGITIAALCAASFALNIYLYKTDTVTAFYSPLTRIWELMAGVGLAYIRQERVPDTAANVTAHMMSIIGLVLIVYGLSTMPQTRNFPGWWALLPVIAATMLIAAGPDAVINRYVLSNRLMVGIGLISFPLYLWHWPALSIATIVQLDTPSVGMRVMLLAASGLLSYLTYRFIETPIRRGARLPVKTIAPIAGLAALALSGGAIYLEAGIPSRMEDKSEFAAYFENVPPSFNYFHRIGRFAPDRIDCNFAQIDPKTNGLTTTVPRAQISTKCFERDLEKPHAVMLWGDSHAQHLQTGLLRNLPPDWQLLMVSSSGCPPLIEQNSDMYFCARSNWFALETIKKSKPDVVILARATNHDATQFRQVVAGIRQAGTADVIVAGPAPRWTSNLPVIVMRKLWSDTPRFTAIGLDQTTFESNDRLVQELAGDPHVMTADILDSLCRGHECATYLGDDRITGLTTFDIGHLTPAASDYVARSALMPLLER